MIFSDSIAFTATDMQVPTGQEKIRIGYTDRRHQIFGGRRQTQSWVFSSLNFTCMFVHLARLRRFPEPFHDTPSVLHTKKPTKITAYSLPTWNLRDESHAQIKLQANEAKKEEVR